MTDTLFEISYQAAVELGGIVVEGKATGGSTTTLVDTGALGSKEFASKDDDFWNGGTAWILNDAGGSSAAPEGEFGEITDYVKSTQTLTFDALTVAVASGDYYAVGKKNYPINILTQKINRVLRKIMIETTDITTITTADNQTEYDLPAGPLELLKVKIEGNTTDSNDSRYSEISNALWDVERTVTGTIDKLVFHNQPNTARQIMLVYKAPHPRIYTSTTQINELVNPDYVVIHTVIDMLNWRYSTVGDGDETLINRRNDFLDTSRTVPMYLGSIAKRKVKKMIVSPKREDYTGEPDKVRLW